MKQVNLFLIDMSHAGNTSGVDRYMAMLLKGLEMYPNIQVTWIHLRHDSSLLFHRQEETAFYTKITIPLPQQFNEIIAEKFWIDKYNEQVYRITQHLFNGRQNSIIHIHTLNIIDLAVYIRSKTNCKIITHLHCIPWKEYYNQRPELFNKLYHLAYIDKKNPIDRRLFVTNNSEIQSYTEPDHIICVTYYAVDFLKNIMNITNNDITIIPNGIDDFSNNSKREIENNKSTIELLYVGILSASKGLKYILEAARKVRQKGHNIPLTIAGKVGSEDVRKIKESNKDLSLNVLGRISFEELTKYYINSDIGIIGSLQEQSSYVALEMAMFGLPVITTDVDGLEEMFTDNLNALKVKTSFSRIKGLRVDSGQMAEKIIALIKNKELRKQLGKNVRSLYENQYTLQRMTNQTVEVYQKIIGGIDNE